MLRILSILMSVGKIAQLSGALSFICRQCFYVVVVSTTKSRSVANRDMCFRRSELIEFTNTTHSVYIYIYLLVYAIDQMCSNVRGVNAQKPKVMESIWPPLYKITTFAVFYDGRMF